MSKKDYLSQYNTDASSHGAKLFKNDEDLTVEKESGYDIQRNQSGSTKDENGHDVQWTSYDCFDENGELVSRNQMLYVYQDGSWSLIEV